jgi:hypothetical protein
MAVVNQRYFVDTFWDIITSSYEVTVNVFEVGDEYFLFKLFSLLGLAKLKQVRLRITITYVSTDTLHYNNNYAIFLR